MFIIFPNWPNFKPIKIGAHFKNVSQSLMPTKFMVCLYFLNISFLNIVCFSHWFNTTWLPQYSIYLRKQKQKRENYWIRFKSCLLFNSRYLSTVRTVIDVLLNCMSSEHVSTYFTDSFMMRWFRLTLSSRTNVSDLYVMFSASISRDCRVLLFTMSGWKVWGDGFTMKVKLQQFPHLCIEIDRRRAQNRI